MNNKCASCGLINFAIEPSCRRCGAAIVAAAPSAFANNPVISQSTQPAIIQPTQTESAARHVRRMIFGLLWFAGGTVVTLGTYISAAQNPNGGHYFIAWGAILFGALDFFVGLNGWMKHKREA
jgi:hypothetical protein